MARQEHWWREPPRWAWASILGGLLVIMVMLPIALNRTAPVANSSDGADASAGEGPPSSEPRATSSEAADAPATDGASSVRVLAVGDSYTGAPPVGGGQGAAWPALLEQRIPGIDVQVAATGNAGYVTAAGDPSLTELVAEADLTEVDLVILFGSRFDAPGIAGQVAAAAAEAITSVRTRAPEATLVVIGPAWPGTAPPAGIRNNRDVIADAADSASVPFVDPLENGWLTGTGLVGEDGVSPTREGHVYLADRIQPIVEEALDARA